MSLARGVDIGTIVNHLAVLYVITMAPERGSYLDQLLDEGMAVAKEVLKADTFHQGSVGWFETYGGSNCDWRHNFYGTGGNESKPIDAFGEDDVIRVEDKIVALAQQAKVQHAADERERELVEKRAQRTEYLKRIQKYEAWADATAI